MNYLYGRDGLGVGSFEGKWLFDEAGNPIGRIHEQLVLSPGSTEIIGRFLADVLYDKTGAPVAVGPNPKLRMLVAAPPRLLPGPERLVPHGPAAAEIGPVRLRPPFDTFALTSSLAKFGD